MITDKGYDAIKDKIHRMSQITGVKEELLHAELDTVEKVSSDVLEEYNDIAGIISSCIELYLNGTSNIKNRQLHENPAKKIHWVVSQALDHINQFYYTDINLSHIAGLYFINEQYLCKLFSKQLGENFSNYVNNVRIEHAKALLTSTNKKIIEISADVGFNNVTYFNSVFKRHTHLTPKEYKKSILYPKHSF